MYQRNKKWIRIVLTGMVVINILMALLVFLPNGMAFGASAEFGEPDSSPANAPLEPGSVRSPLETYKLVNQAVRGFWLDLFPWWPWK